jgi:hypothetical protein
MILNGRRVELVPFLGDSDLTYAYKLVKSLDPRATEEKMVSEILVDGFQFYVGYADGVRAGIAFSKHYRDGLSVDGYTDPTKLTKGQAVWFSMTATRMMVAHLMKHTDVVYVRIDRAARQLERLVKVCGFKFSHYEKNRAVFSMRKAEHQSFDWDSVQQQQNFG